MIIRCICYENIYSQDCSIKDGKVPVKKSYHFFFNFFFFWLDFPDSVPLAVTGEEFKIKKFFLISLGWVSFFFFFHFFGDLYVNVNLYGYIFLFGDVVT